MSANLLLSGQPVRFKRRSPPNKRAIPAPWIEEAVRQQIPIQIWNAYIYGPLKLEGLTISSEITLLRCTLTDPAEFSYSVFERNLTLSYTEFSKGLSLYSSILNHDLRINHAIFKSGRNIFSRVEVKGYTQAIGARFQSDTSFNDARFGPNTEFDRASFEKVTFNAATFGGSSSFKAAVFNDDVDFIGLRTSDDLDCYQARFLGLDHRVSFDVSDTGGDVRFDRCVFEGGATFDGSRIGGQASFRGTDFQSATTFKGIEVGADFLFNGHPRKQESQVQCTKFSKTAEFFDGRVKGNANFERAIFAGSFKFVSMTIAGGTIFRQAQFSLGSRSRFDLTKFEGGAFFQGVNFKDKVDFLGTRFGTVARFNGTRFDGTIRFDASFFNGLAEFNSGEWEGVQYQGTTFQDVTFKHVRFQHDVYFNDALFRGKADFQDTEFRTVYFSESGRTYVGEQSEEQFQNEIDLRGCTYNRIHANWKSLLLADQSGVEYDRQPYTQFENVFSKSGQAEKADAVYLERRNVERQLKWKKRQYLSWFGDISNMVVANYGVRPIQLLVFAVLCIVLGTFFFSKAGSVSPKEKAEATPAPLSRFESLQMSIHQFLPVEIPMGDKWRPSEVPTATGLGFNMRPSVFATIFLKLPGWILVPLGIAALTGLLRRAGSPSLTVGVLGI